MSETRILRAALTDTQVLALVRAHGLEPGLLSPVHAIAEADGDVPPDIRVALVDTGWLRHDAPGFTDDGDRALTCLARPQVRLSLLVGASDWFAATTSLAAGDLSGDEPMLSLVHDDATWYLTWPQPPISLVDVLQDHFHAVVVHDPVPFAAVLTRPEYLALLAVLDHRLDRQLRATLDREHVADESVSVDDALAMLGEGRTSSHLAWQVTIAATLHPDLDLALDEAGMATALEALAGRDVLSRLDDGRFVLTDDLHALAEGLVPLVGFAGVRVDRLTGTATVEVTRIGVRHGLSTVVIEEVLDGDRVLLRSVSSVELADLVLTVRFPGGLRPSTPRWCTECGTLLRPAARFCAHCGTPAAPEGRAT